MHSILLAMVLLAQDRNSSGQLQEIKRLEELVAAGAIAPARLAEAKNNLADTNDSAILDKSLYGRVSLEDFTEEQAAEMVAAATRRLDRQQERVARQQRLIENGVMARSELEPALAELDARKAAVVAANARARLLQELVEMANAEQAVVTMSPSSVAGPAPMVERFQGAGKFDDTDMKRVVLEFEKEFSKPMPVSARGETAVHRALGFDHRGRIDVAVNPDSREGQWIRHFLAVNKIPYIAFRRMIAGQATAPHIHIGPPSPRLIAAD